MTIDQTNPAPTPTGHGADTKLKIQNKVHLPDLRSPGLGNWCFHNRNAVRCDTLSENPAKTPAVFSAQRRGSNTVRVKRSKLRNKRYSTPLHSHMPPRCFWGQRGGCFADFDAQNPSFGHIGVSKLIISGLLALPSYRVITHQNCSLSRPTPPSVLRFEQNPSRNVIFVNQFSTKAI